MRREQCRYHRLESRHHSPRHFGFDVCLSGIGFHENLSAASDIKTPRVKAEKCPSIFLESSVGRTNRVAIFACADAFVGIYPGLRICGMVAILDVPS